jgi:outer membrane protein insertion porin family
LKKRILLKFILLTISFHLSAQLPHSTIISEIRIEGAKRSKVDHLRRFLQSQEGDTYSSEQAEADAQRLQNLYSIASVSFRTERKPNRGLLLIFEIQEAWTLFPLLSIGGVEGNTWFEIGATEINFLGRGMTLAAAYRNIDTRNNYQLFFRQPYLGGSRWGISAGIHRYASTEPLFFEEGAVFYDYTNLSMEAGVSYEFSFGHTLELGGIYFVEDYSRTTEQELENPPGPEALRIPKVLGKLTHRFDRINYHAFHQEGILNVTLLETVYNTTYGDWFHLFLNDFHYFRRYGKRGNLALRFRTGLSTNVNSPFSPFVLDSRINIRGAGNRIDRGTGTLVLNLEYRHTFWEGSLFALQGVVFSDAGAWRTAGGTLDDFVNPDYIRHFVGPGFRFIYKKAFNAMLRLDYGFDLHQKGEKGFVLGYGQYF